MTNAEPGPALVERDGASAQFDPKTPADKQLRDWGWDPNSLNPAQLEVMARRYAQPETPLMPHVDFLGRELAPEELGADDLANAWLHANPDVNGGTKFLALIGDEETRNKIAAKDDQLQKVNAATLGIRPNELGYRTATLNGAAPEISNMASAADKLKAAVDKVIAVHGRARELYNGQYMSDCLTKTGKARLSKLDEYVKALTADGGAAHKAIIDTGAGAQTAFRGFHDVVDKYREDIARYAVTTRHGPLPTRAPGMYGQTFGPIFAGTHEVGFDDTDPKTSVAAGAAQAAAAGDAMGKLFATPVESHAAVEVALPRPNAPSNPGGGGTAGSNKGRSGASPAGPKLPGNDGNPGSGGASLSDQAPLAGVGMPPAPGVPQVPQIPSVPQPPQFPQLPLAGGPNTELAADHADQPQRDSLDPGKEHERRTSPEARAADAALASPPVLRPGDPVRQSQIGADMKPLDKDGDGRMDADAIAPTQHNMDKDRDGHPDKVATAVMIGGSPHAVSVDDPRLLEMMNTLGAATPEQPVDVLDAAAKAGMPLSGYGQFLDDPMSAKTGDVLTGSKGTGFYLEGGQVLMEDGSVKPLIDVLEFRPPHSGFFHLDLPELPPGDDESDGSSIPPSAPPAAPVAPPSSTVPPAAEHQEPAAAPPPAEQPAPSMPAPQSPPDAAAAPVHQLSAQAPPPESDLPFPVITTESAPRSW
ncbi:hypothetical protein H7J87_11870 [Mycolicibacterium wolinskyi]|uniref:Uncharacterized protein n=1 Tax=Mycolicibacterium wolinskyi TaxID=59750 RepID=A0A1X2FJ55_9MYCO|nr:MULTISPECIES: hypothetical protein [Mycolicibacterium]MCV7286028.1 hypothetical protein [Mycolicibacterium wolinskyi]MCV7296224.1 hypothetical protein [Mycolicibacterium goodii]ORX18456.1 hypothetical protein AWC31_14225 [Mycolicibacterium wolinskyi]